MDKQDLEEIAEVLKDTDVLVLSDEIYAELTYGDRDIFRLLRYPICMREQFWKAGFSKAFAMTG